MSQANSDIEEQETTNQTKSLENIDLTNPRERLIRFSLIKIVLIQYKH